MQPDEKRLSFIEKLVFVFSLLAMHPYSELPFSMMLTNVFTASRELDT